MTTYPPPSHRDRPAVTPDAPRASNRRRPILSDDLFIDEHEPDDLGWGTDEQWAEYWSEAREFAKDRRRHQAALAFSAAVLIVAMLIIVVLPAVGRPIL